MYSHAILRKKRVGLSSHLLVGFQRLEIGHRQGCKRQDSKLKLLTQARNETLREMSCAFLVFDRKRFASIFSLHYIKLFLSISVSVYLCKSRRVQLKPRRTAQGIHTQRESPTNVQTQPCHLELL